MRFSKKSLLSASLAVLMAASSFAIPVAVSAVDDTTESTTVATESASENLNTGYNLADDIEDGNILHAFNWYFNDVKKYMKDIAEAGYSTVQVSPVQGNKGTINSTTYACDWWVTYQPINFEIGNNYGTKADFKAMCDEAKKYGIKIIVDIVSNHMAQSDSGVAGDVDESVIADLRDDPDCWHQTSRSVTDSNRYGMTQYTLSGIPDLNTSNEKVQSYVKSLLKECIDCGADGFRFDAAKHIELDTDEAVNGYEFASDFWPNVTSYARELKPDVFIYGEILAPFGTDAENYTQYMRITDSSYGAKVRTASAGTNTPSLTSYDVAGTDASDLVLWVESHDNWVAAESKLKDAQVILGWGIVGARENAPALFLVRPEHEKRGLVGGGYSIAYDELMGGPGNLTWQDPSVVAVNQFKNQFAGQSETLYSDTKLFAVQRGTTGIVVTNYGTTAYEANLQTTLEDGTYTDQVTGAEFTVINGVLSGTVAAKSVAVLYTPETSAPSFKVTLNGEIIRPSDTTLFFADDTASFNCLSDVDDITSYDILVDGKSIDFALMVEPIGDGPGVIAGADAVIGEDVEYGEIIEVTVKATNASGTVTDTYTIQKKDPTETCVAYFDTKGNEDWDTEDAPGIYCYAKDADGVELSEYPGFLMEPVPGTTYVKVELPFTTGTVKFNEGPVSTGLDGRTVPPTVVTYGSATKAANREAGGFSITGSMVWTNGSWQNYADPFKTECTPYALGDVNGDGKINLADALLANKQSVNLITLEEQGFKAADIDGDSAVKLIDAIYLQKYVMRYTVPFKIGYTV